MSLSSEERAHNLEKCRVTSPKLGVLSRSIERMIIVLDAGRLMLTWSWQLQGVWWKWPACRDRAIRAGADPFTSAHV